MENCNRSFTCCDGYNATVGPNSCLPGPSVCAVFLSSQLDSSAVIDGLSRRQVPTNIPFSDGNPPEKRVMTLSELVASKGAPLPARACGPALRLTPSSARQSGAAWYRRKQNVREGFDTQFTFRISNPSLRCDRQDDVNTYCRSRGADGLALVLQDESPSALGRYGSGLGYDGIYNALAVEVDTYFNYDLLDVYENHVSVLTQGWRYNLSANHSYSLASTSRVPDLTDQTHTLRVRYEPVMNPDSIRHPSFQTSGLSSWFVQVSSSHLHSFAFGDKLFAFL